MQEAAFPWARRNVPLRRCGTHLCGEGIGSVLSLRGDDGNFVTPPNRCPPTCRHVRRGRQEGPQCQSWSPPWAEEARRLRCSRSPNLAQIRFFLGPKDCRHPTLHRPPDREEK